MPMAALSVTLDRNDPFPRIGDALPPLWHWLYFPDLCLHSDLADDGHPKRGGIIPPVPLSQRMYAGGRLLFIRDLRVGDSVTRTTRISDVRHREGRTGPLVFVVLHHEISNEDGVALIEEQDIVYREPAKSNGSVKIAKKAPAVAEWTQMTRPSDVLLFRYSALTFNGHRIHYDRRFAAEVEGFPGLVVHGPLIATLLLELLRDHVPGARVASFVFRALKPLFDIEPFLVAGRFSDDRSTVELWAADGTGDLATEATATLA